MASSEVIAGYQAIAERLKLPWVPLTGPLRATLCNEGTLIYWCPGCLTYHGAPLIQENAGPVWKWNGSLSHPTLQPSVLCRGFVDAPRCHHFLREGKLEFLRDCSHKMAGKTVELENEEPKT